jgi:hypothetical protein
MNLKAATFDPPFIVNIVLKLLREIREKEEES